ncbi:MAG: hypothetical protein NTU44_15600 [Bacteroidetes bacterium]|nr:hypothetical protein [Bacteroidota bacterium]
MGEKPKNQIQTIYTPAGSAGEYSPLGLNPYVGCENKCFYCYQKSMMKRWHPEVPFEIVKPRPGFIEALKKKAPKFAGGPMVTLCFACDPYCHLNDQLKLTRQSLQILLENKICAAILTKSGMRSAQDTDIILAFGIHIKVGTTLTYLNASDSKKYESGAVLPAERIKMLKYWSELGVETWTSFEPVLSTQNSLILMELAIPYCQKFKIGKLNHFPAIERALDWPKFLDDAVSLMRKYDKQFIIKSDLLAYNNGTILKPSEVDPRALDVPRFIIS